MQKRAAVSERKGISISERTRELYEQRNKVAVPEEPASMAIARCRTHSRYAVYLARRPRSPVYAGKCTDTVV
jgi:hypothetical protein